MSRWCKCTRVAGLLLLGWVSTYYVAAETNWPRWRGPSGDGHTSESGLPVRWDATSVEWKVPLKGRGHSSPVIWGDRIFLTTALEDGKQRVVFSLDVHDGHLLWEHVAWSGTPEKSHKLNGWASATCVTNGEVVVAFFGNGGLHAYTVEGKHLWSKDLGTFEEGGWGTAACPVIVGDRVIQNGDSDKGAFIEAFDLKTGNSVWRKNRPDNRGWSTPILLERNGRTQLILNGHTGVRSYDPTTGDELWFTPNSNGRGEPTVTASGEMLYVVCGLKGNMYALRLGANAETPETIWSSPRRGERDLPSPIVVGKYVFVSDMKGIAKWYDGQSGNILWEGRLPGLGSAEQYSSSPIAVGGLVFHQNEAGNTVVLEPAASLKVVAQNTVGGAADELFRASLTPYNGHIYSRSDKFLYCIGNSKKTAAN